MNNILVVVIFYLILTTKSSFAWYSGAGKYLDLAFVNYNFFSKTHLHSEHKLILEIPLACEQEYAPNFIGGMLGIGRYFFDNTLVTLEGEFHSKYNLKAPKRDPNNVTMPTKQWFMLFDQPKIGSMTLTANVYYNFDIDEYSKNYYVAIGLGINRIDFFSDHSSAYLKLLQFKVGINYPKIMFFTPYIDYKYVYAYTNMISPIARLGINSKTHNVAIGIVMPISDVD